MRAFFGVGCTPGSRMMHNARSSAIRNSGRVHTWGACGTLCALLTACGGSGSNSATSAPPAGAPPPPPSVSAADAARLLEQATFGVTASDVAHVQGVGIDAYINEQLAYAADSVHRIQLYAAYRTGELQERRLQPTRRIESVRARSILALSSAARISSRTRSRTPINCASALHSPCRRSWRFPASRSTRPMGSPIIRTCF